MPPNGNKGNYSCLHISSHRQPQNKNLIKVLESMYSDLNFIYNIHRMLVLHAKRLCRLMSHNTYCMHKEAYKIWYGKDITCFLKN